MALFYHLPISEAVEGEVHPISRVSVYCCRALIAWQAGLHDGTTNFSAIPPFFCSSRISFASSFRDRRSAEEMMEFAARGRKAVRGGSGGILWGDSLGGCGVMRLSGDRGAR